MPETTQRFRMEMDISQIESGINRLAALQQKVFAQQPPPINLPNIVPPNFAKQLGNLDPAQQLAAIARVQGAMEATIKRAETLGVTSKAQSQQLAAGAGVGPNVPYPSQLIKDPKLADPLLAQGYNIEQIKAASQAKYAARASVYGSKSEDAAALEAAALRSAQKGLEIQEASNAAQAAELSSTEKIAAAQTKKEALIRKNIALLEAELGLEASDNGQLGINQLAEQEQYLRGVRHVRNQAVQKRGEFSDEALALKQAEVQAVLNSQRATTTAGTIAAEEALIREKIKAAEFERLSSKEALTIKAQRIIAEREYNRALNLAIADELKLRGASKFEIQQARGGHYRGGATGGLNTGEFFSSGFLNTIKYAAPSALIFGGIAGLAASLKEAQELQKIMVQIRTQMEAFGRLDSFQQTKEDILAIAASSGTSSVEVANLAFQFQGAFGGDTQKAIEETEAAIRATTVTGLELTETIDAFTAITQSFKDSSVSIEEISDTALGLQERFGVLAKETIAFASDLAPVASEIGLTARELEVLGAVAQKYSGKSGSSLAEAFGRILPTLQANAVDIINLFKAIGPAGDDAAANLTTAFASADTGSAFRTILQNYDQLNDAQTKQLISLLGGRREAQAIIPVLENSSELFNELNREQSDAGKTSEYYGEVQATLSRQLAILGENLKQVGIKLFEGGLGQALSSIVEAGSTIISVLGDVFGIVANLNEAFGGIPLTLVAIVGSFKLLTAVSGVFSETLKNLIVTKNADTVATQANTTAQTQNAQSRIFQVNSAGVATVVPAAQLGVAGSVSQAFKSGYQSFNPGVALSGIQAGAYGKAAGTAAQGLGAVGASAEGAARGLGAFANAIPAPLIWAGLFLAVTNLISTINEVRAKAETEVNTFLEGLEDQGPESRKAKSDEIRRQAGTYSTFDDIAAAIAGYPTSSDLLDIAGGLDNQGAAGGNAAGLRAAAQRLRGASSQQLSDIGIKYSTGAVADWEGLAQRLEDGTATPEDYASAQEIINNLESNSETFFNEYVSPAVEEGQKRADEASAEAQADADRKNAALNKLNNVNSEISSIKNKIDSGQISVGQGLSELNSVISTYEDLLESDPNALTNIEGAEEKYISAKKARSDLLSQAASNDIENYLKVTQFLGPDNLPEGKINALLSLVQNKNLSPADRSKVTDQILDAYSDLYQYRLETATSIEEQVDLLTNGVPIDEATRIAVVSDQLKSANDEFQQYIAGLPSDDIKQFLNESSDDIATLIVNQGVSVQEATAAVLLNRAKVLRAKADSEQAALDAGKAFGTYGREEIDARQASIDQLRSQADEAATAAEDIKQGGLNLGQVFDPFRFKEQVSPQEIAKRISEFNKARISYLKSLNDGDSVAQAQLDVQAAQQQLALLPQGTKEWFEAAADLNSAQNALKNALKARQQSRFEYLKALAGDDPVATAQIELQSAQSNLASASADEYDSARAAVVNAQRALREAEESRRKSYFDYLKQVYSDDPLQAADISVQAAQYAVAIASSPEERYAALAQLDAAQKEQQDAILDYQKAQLELQAAYVSGDPVATAQIAQRQADLALSNAKGQAERLRAEAQKVAANRQLEDAIRGVLQAQLDLLLAVAQAGGDTVKAAQISLDAAQRRLIDAQNRFSRGEIGAADVIGAQTDVVRAQAELRDARLQDQLEQYQFMYDMGRITRTQFIAYLEQLKQVPDLTTQQIRDLDRQIKSLRGELQQDLQTNLPTNIELPTLYEVRRLNQSTSGTPGGDGPQVGYQDNRNVQISVVVNDGADLQAVEQIFNDALGTNRYGNQARRY